MASKGYEHTAHYTYIDQALRAQWPAFRALEDEMAAFAPQPMEAFSARRNQEVERLRVLNPGTPVDELAAFVDKQIGYLASRDWQFHEKFDERHMTLYVTVTMLSHALTEALINAILAIGLAQAGSADLFSILEKAEVKQKWLFGPKSFAPSYSFPMGTGLHETLTSLCRQRNALVHHKIELTMGGAKVLRGSPFQRQGYDQEQRWLRRYFSLPYDLEQLPRKAIPGTSILLLFNRKPIEMAPAHAGA